jgi:hypothetical protein
MPATAFDITICQGSDFQLDVQVNRSNGDPWDMSTPGTTVAAKMRVTFNAVPDTAFTTAIITAATGNVRISLTAAQTAALVGPGGTDRANRYGVYDIEFTEGGIVTRVLEGRVSLSQEATK